MLRWFVVFLLIVFGSPAEAAIAPYAVPRIEAADFVQLVAAHGASSTYHDANGWTQFVPLLGDTKIVFVSSSSGDNNACAAQSSAGIKTTPVVSVIGTPCQTLAKGVSLLRTGHADWLLLKKGDTWTNENFGGNLNIAGKSIGGVMLFGAYGPPGARPIMATQGASAQDCMGWTFSNPAAGNYIALDGIEFYSYDTDPTNLANFVPAATKLMTEHGCTNWTAPNFNWSLVEDCKFSYYMSDTLVWQKTSTLDPLVYNLTVRRNIIAYSYVNNLAHSSGMFMNNVANVLLEENVWVHNGWNEPLMAPQTVTMVVGGNVTWTGNNWVTGFEIGNPVFFCDSTSLPVVSSCAGGDTLPTGYSHNTTYFIYDISGSSFSLSSNSVSGKFGNFVIGNPIVTMAFGTTTAGMTVGDKLYNTGTIADGFTIVSVDSSSQFTMSAGATFTRAATGMYFLSPAIVTSGSESGTHQMSWQNFWATDFNHSFYMDCSNGNSTPCGAQPPKAIRNISVEAALDALHDLSGIIDTDNLVMKSASVGPIVGNTANSASYNVVLYPTPLQAGPLPVGARNGFDVAGVAAGGTGGLSFTNNIWAHNTGGSSTYAIRLDSGVTNTTGTGNIACDWQGGLIQDLSGNGTNSIGGTFQNAACNMGPDPTNATIEAYDLSLGGPGTYAHFMAQAQLMSKDNQLLGTFNPAYMAHPANNFIRGKLGVPLN